MKKRFSRIILPAIILILCAAACGPAPTPDPNVPVTLENACDFAGQVVELEGMLILPRGVSCSEEEPATCRMTLYDPFRELTIDVDIPVHTFTGSEALPANHMAALPESYAENDFILRTANERLAGDGSLVSVRGTVGSVSYGGSSCALEQIEAITRIDHLLYVGVDLTRVTLLEAITEGLVVASITGDGLTRIDLRLKPNVDSNLEVEIEPGTLFISGTDGVQNMVVREEAYAYLKEEIEISLEVEVSCANMELKQPGGEDAFTVSDEPPDEDLVKLFALDEFQFEDAALRQFAVWTITDNPPSGGYVGIEADGYTELPWEDDIARLRSLFELAGIDPTAYAVFAE